MMRRVKKVVYAGLGQSVAFANARQPSFVMKRNFLASSLSLTALFAGGLLLPGAVRAADDVKK